MISPNALLKTEMDPVRLLRLFTVIPAVLILLAGGGILWIYFFVLSLQPEGQTVVDTPGLSAEAKVIRDASGVPAIIAEKVEDLALVLGYVMAQDRLWQMDYLRRAGQGRLAEILGPDYLESDHLIRTVTAGKPAEDPLAKLDSAERKWLDRFIEGVNVYISSRSAKPPVEFSLLEYGPGLFSPEDVKSVATALAWSSSIAARVDPVMVRVLARLGPERGLGLFPGDPTVSPQILLPDTKGWDPAGFLFTGGVRSLGRVPGLRGGWTWAARGTDGSSGTAMVGSAVYQTLSAPGFWYRARLSSGDFHLSGAFIPGLPVAIAGTNNSLSWGCAAAPADDADLFQESVSTESEDDYWRVDRWRKMRKLNEHYRVKGGSAVTRTLRLTETGPLVSDIHQGMALSLRWTGRAETGLFRALYSINRARSARDVKDGAALLIAPCLNVVWGDAQGNFGVQFAGRVPVRCSGSDGILPMPAWTGVHDWKGFIPFDELPARVSPPERLVAVSDERPGGQEYPYLVSCYWNDEARADRIRQVLQDGPGGLQKVVYALQNDSFSPMARQLTPLLTQAVRRAGNASPEEGAAAALLEAWDFQMGKDSAAAAIFALSYQSLVKELFLKPLGEQLYEGFTGYYPLSARIVRSAFVEGKSTWLAGSDPDRVLVKSFREAVSAGKDLMGNEPAKWKWGSVHSVVFRHPLAARSRFLEALYHVGPAGIPGSGDSLNYAGWSTVHPFQVLEGVTLAHVCAVTDPPQIMSVGPLGVSAHFFSANYKGQTKAWADGRLLQEPSGAEEQARMGGNAVVFRPGVGHLTRSR